MVVSDPLDRPSEMYLRMRGTSASGEEVSLFRRRINVRIAFTENHFFDNNINVKTTINRMSRPKANIT